MKPVRVALVGVGGIGGYHRRVLHNLPEFEFIAAAERHQDIQADAVAEVQSWGVPMYEDIWEMLDEVDVEGICIACPHHFHAEYTLGCLERGIHVLCEKPTTVTIQDARAVAETAQRTELFAGVDFQYVSYPHSRQLKQMLVDGVIGELREIIGVLAWKRLDEYYTRSHWVGKRFVEGRPCFDGVLMNQAVHLLNSALQLGTRRPVFAEPVAMQAELYSVHAGIETEDLACLRAQLDEATLYAYATTCKMEGNERTTFEIIGSEGTVTWDESRALITRNNGEEIILDTPHDRDDIHRNWAQCIRGEAEELYAPASEGLKATLAVNAAYSSAGRIQRITWDDAAEIGDLIDTASDQRKLFSEMNIPWAYQGNKIDLTNYTEFQGEIVL